MTSADAAAMADGRSLLGDRTKRPADGPRTVDGAPSGGGVLQVVRRLGWGVADQAVSSLSNFAVGVYVARTFGAAAFGAFSLAWATYTVVLNAARGTASDPLLVRYSGSVRRRWRRAVSAATGTALLVGIASGLVCLGVGLVLPDPVGPAFVALGIALPGLILQDSWRFAFFAGGRSISALINDVVWSSLLIGALLLLQKVEGTSVFRCLVAFGVTASLAAVVGSVQAGVLPRPRLAAGWLREHRQLSMRFLAENVTASGALQIRAFVLGAVSGLASVGFVRGAEILMGPFIVVLMGVSLVAVPEASRVFQRSSARLTHFCLALGAVQAVTALAWGLVLLLLLPLGLGRLLLAEIWAPTSKLMPAMTLSVAAACFSTAATAGLRAMGLAWRSLRAQLILSTAYVVLGAVGAVLGGASGTCWGILAANTIGAIAAWSHLRAALAAHHQGLEATA